MKRFLLFMLGFLYLHAYSVNLSVGQTQILSFTAPRNLQGCQWTISRPNDIVFTTSPAFYSTSVEVKAIHGFPSSSPCIVQCKYHYLELDPVSGRYIYSRTGSQEWRIYVEEQPIQGSSEGTGSSRIELNTHSMIVEQDSWGNLLYPLSYNGPVIRWEYDDKIASVHKYYNAPNTVEIKGGAIGRTYIKCMNDYGGSDICELNVIPKSHYTIGEDIKIFFNGEVLNYQVLTNNPKTCKLYMAYNNVRQSYLSIPEGPAGYTLTTIGKFAFNNNTHIERVVIPETVEIIDDKAFMDCSSLKEIFLPDNLKTIGEWAFYHNNNLQKVIFPKSLKTIGMLAFSGCPMDTIHLEEGLTVIGEGAFQDVPAKQLIIPSTVQSIGDCAFNGPGPNPFPYESIICKIENPSPIPEYVFNKQTYDETILYVPHKSKSLYKSTDGWNKFKNIEAYDFNDYPSLNSLNDAIEVAKSLIAQEYSEPFAIEFEPVVIYTNGAFNYISHEGKYFVVDKDNLGVGAGHQIKKGWTARIQRDNGLPKLVPLEDTEIICGDMIGIPEPLLITSAQKINEDLISAMVRIRNVIITSKTPEKRSVFWGRLKNGQIITFFNDFELPSQPSGTYDVLAIVGISGTSPYLAPIEFINPDAVDEIHVEEHEEFYNLQGLRVTNPQKGGIYIVKKGQHVEKITIP